MNPGSSIRYSRDAAAPARELFLEGEAYFDVARDAERPFFVYAGEVVTRVLGTSFIIRADNTGDQVTVSVKSGSVTVYSRNAEHKKTVLAPNQEAVYDRVKDAVSTQVVAPQETPETRRNVNEMHFDETSVPEVLGMLGRTYNMEIVFDTATLSGCVLTSSFYEEGLYDRIDVICTAIGATYRIVDQQIVIESEGCNLNP
jgi:transmembrane sensor